MNSRLIEIILERLRNEKLSFNQVKRIVDMYGTVEEKENIDHYVEIAEFAEAQYKL